MALFVSSVFLSAFLLFQLQPMVGKLILPWFGGTPAVWSTVMLFFQVLLTGGYAYAYWLIGRVRHGRQALIHVALIASTVAAMVLASLAWDSPITPDARWRPQDVNSPILDIFKLLLVSIGLPYFILAANGPLMQAWFSRRFAAQSYGWLYALSNLGSLLGLVAYPFLIEPLLSLRVQGWIWSVGFICFALLAGSLALQNMHVAPSSLPGEDPVPPSVPPSMALQALWITLSATASLLLLSVTNQISQEVAVIPFLWVLPLILYLLSFILAFSGRSTYNRKFYGAFFVLAAMAAVFAMLNATHLRVYWQIMAYSTLLFSACMLCHGELYLLRPAARYLTSFYLMISIGGALGGIFVSLVSPLVFNGHWEFFVALAMVFAILLAIVRRNAPENLMAQARFVFTVFLLVTGMLALLGRYDSGALYSRRNFYGVIRIREVKPDGSTERAYAMSNGITVHGLQFILPDLRNAATTYYVPASGAGLAILHHPKYETDQPMRVGLLGLGVGTLATYGRRGDVYRLYEINPIVLRLAAGEGSYFSFLSESQASITTVLGDARISLERELGEGQPQNFDILVLDTFSSDSIPVHLLTKEAFALYLAHLAPEGVIAAHITNLHLDLQPVVWQIARHYGLSLLRVDYEGDAKGGYESHWILLSRDPAVLASPDVRTHALDLTGYSTDIPLWTDNYSNLFQILK